MSPDSVITLFSNVDLFWLLLAFAGGAFGAMIGANWAFSFVGLMILTGLGITAGTGNSMFLDYVAFGPVFGPHIAFAGAVAATAYAARRGALAEGGNATSTPLAGLNRPDVLLVGALFGACGYVLQRLITHIPWFGPHTDSVALTIVISAVAVRLLFGRTPVSTGLATPSDDAAWLRWQEKPGQLATISVFASMMAAGASVMFAHYAVPLGQSVQDYPQLMQNAQVLPFAISAVCVFFVAAGLKFPVTHHMTLIAGLAAVQFFAVLDNGLLAVAIGTVFGVVSGFVGEFSARMFHDKGDTHFDPPASAIWLMTTLVWVALIPFQG